MKSEELLELLNGIGSDIVENAGSVAELYESSREGVSFRAEYSRKRTLKTVIVSIAATAAAMFGLFALLNVVKGGFFNRHGGPGATEQSGYIYSSEEQTFTKDFGKLVLTITTDKAEYNIGEPINITATLENTTDEDIDLNNTLDAFVLYFDDLIEYPCMGSEHNLFPNVERINGKETLEQHCTFLTYTDYIDTVSETGDIEYSPDYGKPAATGVHIGHFGLSTKYSVTPGPMIADFSITLNGETTESKNKAQTFTKDFDGLVLTVTTDKSTYNIGEPIELTATLENNTGKDIILYYGTCGTHGYDGQKAGTTAELLPRFDKLIEYPIRSAVWFNDAITEIPFKKGEKCVQKFTFQTYTGYLELDYPPQTGEFKNAVVPDMSKVAESGVHYGKLTVMIYSDGEARDHITDCTLDFSVTVASSNENNDSDTENKPSEKMTGIYGETEISDIPCGDKDYEGKANVIQESDALRQCLESMVFETHNFGDYTVKLIGDSVRTDKKNFPGSIYAQKLRIEIGKNGTKTEDMIYNDTLLYQSQFHTEYRLFADKIGSYLDIYKLECPVIAMRYFFDDDPARTVTKAVEFAVIQKDRLCGGFVGTSAAGTGVTMNPNMDWSDYRTILAPNTSDGERCRLSVFAADEFTVIDGKTLTDEEAGIEYTFDFSDPPPFELYAAEKIMS